MAIFGANLSCKLLYRLHNQIFSIPWLKNGAIASLKSRVYCSSVPVRYIPKETRNSETSPPVSSSKEEKASELSGPNALRIGVFHGGNGGRRKFISDEKLQNPNRDENEIPMNDMMFDDAELEFKEEIDCEVTDHEIMEELEEVVEECEIDKEKDHHGRNVSQASKTKQDAGKLAIELLATRAFTAVELRKKLHGKKFPFHIVEAVINDFQSRGLINDCLYAETFSRSRWSSSSWGPRRIKQALLKKGVSEVDVEKAIRLVFREGESGGDEDSNLGLSKVSMDHLFVQASKQWLRGQDVAHETRKSRIIRWLQYRGFNWGVIGFILKKLESQYSP